MRERIKINQDWKFLKGDDSSSSFKKYNDVLWEDVCLPHCVELAPVISSGGRNYQGISRYRKYFSLAKPTAKERVLIEFEGAMQILELWINGQNVGTHYCGYTPGIFDITDYIVYDEENTISVRLDNSDYPIAPPGKPQGTLDFTYEGGIYKSVYIHRLPEVHVTNAILENIVAGGGLFVRYENVTQESAGVKVKAHLKNITECEKNITLKQIIKDECEVVAEVCEEIKLLANSAEHFDLKMTVLNPKLWSPNHPNLYILETVIEENSEIIDKVETTIGIRNFEFTARNGFFMNGEHIKLSGGNYHMTFGQIGNAMPDNLLRRDARKLREAGMLNVRSHYPFPDAFIDECNKLGMTLIICNPGWQWFKEGIFKERAYQNIRDIIHKQRNHPAVVLWEAILNESNDMTVEFQQTLSEIAHEEIPDSECYTSSDSGYSDVAYKWFDPRMYGDAFIRAHPEEFEESCRNSANKPLFVREYGDCPDNFGDQNTVWRTPRAWGEDMMIKQVRRMIWDKELDWMTNYRSHYNEDFLCGFNMWPAIEHNRGYHMNPCYGGMLDLHRIPKYSFYFFKSQQSVDVNIENIPCGPMIFLANSWSELSPDDITVYSNCEKVRLYHNNVLIEEKEPDDIPVPHAPFTFKNNFYYGRERSEIRVEGLIGDEVVATDARFSPGVTVKMELVPDTDGIDLVADGSDVIFVRLYAKDDHGNTVPRSFDAHDVVFEISGEGKILGDNVKHTELGVTGILVQSTKNAGKIIIKTKLKYPLKYDRRGIENGYLEIITK